LFVGSSLTNAGATLVWCEGHGVLSCEAHERIDQQHDYAHGDNDGDLDRGLPSELHVVGYPRDEYIALWVTDGLPSCSSKN
jgi:hypothetical protein